MKKTIISLILLASFTILQAHPHEEVQSNFICKCCGRPVDLSQIQNNDIQNGDIMENEGPDADVSKTIIVPKVIQGSQVISNFKSSLNERQEFSKNKLNDDQFEESVELNLDLQNYKSYLKREKYRKDGVGMLIAGGAIGGFGVIYTLYTSMKHLGLDEDKKQASILVSAVTMVTAVPLIVGGSVSLNKMKGITILKKDGKELGMDLNYYDDTYELSLNLSF